MRESSPGARKFVILVVEDDDDTREQVSDLLTGEGYQVVPVADGGKALAVLAQLKPDLILLDLMLPVVSGWEVLAELTANPALGTIPVVVMSAFVDQALPGVACALRKPLGVDELRSVVRRVFS